MSESELNCTMEAISKYVGKEKAIVTALTPECPNGQLMKEVLREMLPTFKERGITAIELEADTKKCRGLLDQLKVEVCPTVMFYRNGKEVSRFVPSGENPEQVKAILLVGWEKRRREGPGESGHSTAHYSTTSMAS